MTLQDVGSIGELIGAIATVATLAYLAVQIRHNTRGLDQNNIHLRMTFESQVRNEGHQLRSLIASDPELAGIWRRGLAGETLDRLEQDRFELLVVNILNILKAEYDGGERRLATDHRATYVFLIARTPGFKRWWEHRRAAGGDSQFGEWLDRLIAGEPDLAALE